MKVVIGLGNPGIKYWHTRHNVGFLISGVLAKRYNIPLDKEGFFSCYGIGEVRGIKVLIAQPQTFMNLSGKTVTSIRSHYKSIQPEDIIVIHDDIDLKTGRIKVKLGGGDAGHRGVRSIASTLGTQMFFRVRVGVGRSDNNDIEISQYVLSPFTDEEMTVIKASVAEAEIEVVDLLGSKKTRQERKKGEL